MILKTQKTELCRNQLSVLIHGEGWAVPVYRSVLVMANDNNSDDMQGKSSKKDDVDSQPTLKSL